MNSTDVNTKPGKSVISVHNEDKEQLIPIDAPLDYITIELFPRLPLSTLLAADSTGPQPETAADQSASATDDQLTNHEALFENTTIALADELVIDVNPLDDNSEAETEADDIMALGDDVTVFEGKAADILVRCMMRVQLPGLSRLEQMYLLAMAESLAKITVDTDKSGEVIFLFVC